MRNIHISLGNNRLYRALVQLKQLVGEGRQHFSSEDLNYLGYELEKNGFAVGRKSLGGGKRYTATEKGTAAIDTIDTIERATANVTLLHLQEDARRLFLRIQEYGKLLGHITRD